MLRSAASTPSAPATRSAESFVSLGYPRERIERLPEALLRSSYPSGCPIKEITARAGDRIVDIGAGGGFDCILLELDAPPGVTVVGVDPRQGSFREAREVGQGWVDGISFVAADGRSLPIASGTADWVTANGVLCVVPEPERVLEEAFRILRPGGTLVIGFLLVSLPRPFGWLGRSLAGIRRGRSEQGYVAMLHRHGFRHVRVAARHDYTVEQAADLWGTRAATRRILKWGRARWARPIAGRLMRFFHGVDLSAVKPD